MLPDPPTTLEYATPEEEQLIIRFGALVAQCIEDGNRQDAHDAVTWAFEDLARLRKPLRLTDSVAKVTTETTARHLRGAGIRTVGQLVELSHNDLTEGIGLRGNSVKNLDHNLHRHGYRLRSCTA